MIEINKKELQAKKAELENCKIELKKHFIGIDNIIDDLLDYIQVWYLMPDILVRPVIVNLWGMTGVGKTDLIRKMIKLLNFQDRFAEIELSNVDETSWERSVSNVLENYGFHNGEPCVVLFDEIQRFNTIDNLGNPLPQTKFMDFWELLSDGRLSKKQKDDLDYYLFNFMSKKKENQRKKDKGEAIENENPLLGMYEAQSLKKTLGLKGDVMDMMEMTESQMMELIIAAKKKKAIYEPINHSKSLIIISGNLDDAFSMAHQISEADVDADIFHAYTKKITVVDVKNSLSKKFRPEQVARFGNIHLIYSSLRKQDFALLIKREIERIIKSTKEKLGIKLEVSNSVNELIYRNGVFPVQGVRPVFSSVIDILDANLSKLLFMAVVKNQKSISVDYDFDKKFLMCKVGTAVEKINYEGRIDKIRQGNVLDNVTNISVHECGHAVAYMALFGMAPLQLKSKVASSYAAGFTFPHAVYQTKGNIIKKIKIYLAGGIAEDIIFGKMNASVGRSNDREEATMLALDFIRKYGFDEEFQSTYNIETFPYQMDKTITDIDIEKMMARLVSETKELLTHNIELLKTLSKNLVSKGSMEAKEVATVAKQFGINASVKTEGYLHIDEYNKLLGK